MGEDKHTLITISILEGKRYLNYSILFEGERVDDFVKYLEFALASKYFRYEVDTPYSDEATVGDFVKGRKEKYKISLKPCEGENEVLYYTDEVFSMLEDDVYQEICDIIW